jgi:zinc protease
VTVRDEKVREPQLQRAYIVPSCRDGRARRGGGAQRALRDPGWRRHQPLLRQSGARRWGATYAGSSYQTSGLDDTRFIIYGLPKPGTNLRDLEMRMEEVVANLQENGVTGRGARPRQTARQ